jgi:hypothetical protein
MLIRYARWHAQRARAIGPSILAHFGGHPDR